MRGHEFVRWNGPKYLDDGIVFSASKTDGSVCSFRASKQFLEALDARQLSTLVAVLDGLWRWRDRLQRLALARYNPGGRVDLHGQSTETLSF